MKHRSRIKAAVVSESVLIKVRLQVRFANRMVNTADSGLNEHPESLNRVGMGIAGNVNLLAVIALVSCFTSLATKALTLPLR
jgi:hypothetical protein